MCPEISRAEYWKSQGWGIVLQEARRQVRADGFHFEQSTYYHVYAIDFFLHAAMLARLNELTVPGEFEKTLENMLDALLLLGRASAPPRLGDDDGGRLFDPRRNRSEHLLDPLATGAVLFRRGDFKGVAGELREETIWLLGEQGVAEWDRLRGSRRHGFRWLTLRGAVRSCRFKSAESIGGRCRSPRWPGYRPWPRGCTWHLRAIARALDANRSGYAGVRG